MFPRMILACANDLETMFPCRVTQQTFRHWKQTLAHAQLRKLRAYVTTELRKRGNNGCRNKMFLKKIINFFCFPETKNVSATNVSFMETFTETCFLNNVFVTMFPRLRGPLNLHVMVKCKVYGMNHIAQCVLARSFLSGSPHSLPTVKSSLNSWLRMVYLLGVKSEVAQKEPVYSSAAITLNCVSYLKCDIIL